MIIIGTKEEIEIFKWYSDDSYFIQKLPLNIKFIESDDELNCDYIEIQNY